MRERDFTQDGDLLLFVILSILDAALTFIVLSFFGGEERLLLKYIAANIPLLVSLKMLIVFVVVWLAEKELAFSENIFWFNFLLFGVVGWNTFQLMFWLATSF